MKLREKLFGPRENPEANATALKKEKTLAMINEADLGAKPRARRTVGLTELETARGEPTVVDDEYWRVEQFLRTLHPVLETLGA